MPFLTSGHTRFLSSFRCCSIPSFVCLFHVTQPPRRTPLYIIVLAHQEHPEAFKASKKIRSHVLRSNISVRYSQSCNAAALAYFPLAGGNNTHNGRGTDAKSMMNIGGTVMVPRLPSKVRGRSSFQSRSPTFSTIICEVNILFFLIPFLLCALLRFIFLLFLMWDKKPWPFF